MIEAKVKHTQIERAEKLAHGGQVEEAVRLLVQSNERQPAADLLAQHKRFQEAGQLLLHEIKDRIELPGMLSEADRQMAFMAAYYFQKAGEYQTAAEILVRLGDVAQVKGLYQLCWERYGSCHSLSSEYRAGCRVLILLSCALHEIPADLAVFLAPFFASGIESEEDVEAFYQMGLYYLRQEFTDHARMMFAALSRKYASYKDVSRLLERLHQGQDVVPALQSSDHSVNTSLSSYMGSSATKEVIRHMSHGSFDSSPRMSPPPGSIPAVDMESTTEVSSVTTHAKSSQPNNKSIDMNESIRTMERAAVKAIGVDKRVVVRRRLARLSRSSDSMDDCTVEQTPVVARQESTWSEKYPTADILHHDPFPSSDAFYPEHRHASPPTMPMPVGSDKFLEIGDDVTQEQEVVSFCSVDAFDAQPSFSTALNTELVLGSLVGGRYKIVEILGQGGMATVYRAVDTELDEDIALKVFEAGASFQEGLQRLKKELKLSRRLSHPNIIRLHDIGAHGSYHYLSMELLHGIDLETLLEQRGVVSIAQGLDILLQVCQGLQAVHEKGVIHRDLKPSNIFLTQDGVVKLMDFGIATHHASSRLTAEGVVVGTAAYMAPERVTGRKDASVLGDMYALGVIAFEMFTGQLPFFHEKIMRLFLMHVNDPVPSPRSVNPEIPAALSHIIETLMAKNPQKRISSCADLAVALRTVPVAKFSI